VSEPQFAWGKRVLDRLALRGDETVVDAGCGAGRLTELLAQRVPRGHVTALDRSAAMVAQTRARLAPLGDRVAFVCDDVASYVSIPPVDVVFSTATFHWVRDHDHLFMSIFASLKPGGRLVAQWGGGPNLARLRGRAAALQASERFARHFVGWEEFTNYRSPDDDEASLRRAGFANVRVWLEAAPARFEDAAAFREFVSIVNLRENLARLPEEADRRAFLDAIVDAAAKDAPAFELDYWRLNADAIKDGPS
jgi:trans-aconitate 2-methyltransferase